MLCYFRVLVMIVYCTAYSAAYLKEMLSYIYDITGGQFNIQLSVFGER